MDRLTHKRCNGIKDGYWSPAKKEELVQRLAAYENTGLEPEKIHQIDQLYQELSREVMQFRKDLARMPNAWQPLPEPYRPKENDDKKKVIPSAPASWRYHMEKRFQKRT